MPLPPTHPLLYAQEPQGELLSKVSWALLTFSSFKVPSLADVLESHFSQPLGLHLFSYLLCCHWSSLSWQPPVTPCSAPHLACPHTAAE